MNWRSTVVLEAPSELDICTVKVNLIFLFSGLVSCSVFPYQRSPASSQPMSCHCLMAASGISRLKLNISDNQSTITMFCIYITTNTQTDQHSAINKICSSEFCDGFRTWLPLDSLVTRELLLQSQLQQVTRINISSSVVWFVTITVKILMRPHQPWEHELLLESCVYLPCVSHCLTVFYVYCNCKT